MGNCMNFYIPKTSKRAFFSLFDGSSSLCAHKLVKSLLRGKLAKLQCIRYVARDYFCEGEDIILSWQTIWTRGTVPELERYYTKG